MITYCRGDTPRTPLAIHRLLVSSIQYIKYLILICNILYIIYQYKVYFYQYRVYTVPYVPLLSGGNPPNPPRRPPITYWPHNSIWYILAIPQCTLNKTADQQLIHAIEFALKNNPKYCILAFLVCTNIKTAANQLIISWCSADTYH